MNEEEKYLDFASEIVNRALKKGVDEAEVYLEKGNEFSLEIKDGEIETLQQSGSKGFGLRIFKSKKLAFGYSSDFSAESIDKLIDELIVLAGYSDSDDCNGLPSEDQKPAVMDLGLYDDKLPLITTEEKIDIVRRMEGAAKDYDKRVYKFRTSKLTDWSGLTVLVNSNGFTLSRKDTYAIIVCVPIAEEGDKKESSFWYSINRFFQKLDSPEDVGRIAAERAVSMLGARPVESQVVPVIFSPPKAADFCNNIATALKGYMVFRGNTFLLDKLGKQVASNKVTLVDDGLIPGALASKSFDGEGIAPIKKKLIEGGILKSYLFDLYYGRKLASTSTGNASRSYSSLPSISTTNFYLENGDKTPEEIIKNVDSGLYLVNTMGEGLKYSTGDYSVGAEGFWIEKGKISFPVSQITISGNMIDMLNNIEEIGNDLVLNNSTSSPTIKISQMTVSGK